MKIVHEENQYGLRRGAVEFPMMIVISTIYPCNFGCPMCPYTDGNSEIRSFYRDRNAELFPEELWNKIAEEAGPYGAWLRCTGGGEPMLHHRMVDMIEFARSRGARVWLNTNGSLLGPHPRFRQKLERIVAAGIDLIEFSMDAGEAEIYARVRPPRGGPPRDPEQWFNNHVGNIRAALELRKKLKSPTRIVVSMIRQDLVESKLDDYVRFYLEDVGVDDVITRKFLSWDDNTNIDLGHSMDKHLYKDMPSEKKEPCVWPFERMNVDTLGRVALCGQDVSFRTAEQFPTLWEQSVKEVWQGEMFNWYRRMHLEGRGCEAWPCRNCSAWFAGIRDWDYGWLRVLKTSGDRMRSVLAEDLGAEVEIYQPDHDARVVSG
ncbi:MAG: radical SAM protein [Armatimonadetes bacterium]|nr:radical SAM protein [Armatimonadota bacterium]